MSDDTEAYLLTALVGIQILPWSLTSNPLALRWLVGLPFGLGYVLQPSEVVVLLKLQEIRCRYRQRQVVPGTVTRSGVCCPFVALRWSK
jgi:hypothetical protein